jgi:hypothetical protein
MWNRGNLNLQHELAPNIASPVEQLGISGRTYGSISDTCDTYANGTPAANHSTPTVFNTSSNLGGQYNDRSISYVQQSVVALSEPLGSEAIDAAAARGGDWTNNAAFIYDPTTQGKLQDTIQRQLSIYQPHQWLGQTTISRALEQSGSHTANFANFDTQIGLQHSLSTINPPSSTQPAGSNVTSRLGNNYSIGAAATQIVTRSVGLDNPSLVGQTNLSLTPELLESTACNQTSTLNSSNMNAEASLLIREWSKISDSEYQGFPQDDISPASSNWTHWGAVHPLHLETNPNIRLYGPPPPSTPYFAQRRLEDDEKRRISHPDMNHVCYILICIIMAESNKLLTVNGYKNNSR